MHPRPRPMGRRWFKLSMAKNCPRPKPLSRFVPGRFKISVPAGIPTAGFRGLSSSGELPRGILKSGTGKSGAAGGCSGRGYGCFYHWHPRATGRHAAATIRPGRHAGESRIPSGINRAKWRSLQLICRASSGRRRQAQFNFGHLAEQPPEAVAKFVPVVRGEILKRQQISGGGGPELKQRAPQRQSFAVRQAGQPREFLPDRIAAFKEQYRCRHSTQHDFGI